MKKTTRNILILLAVLVVLGGAAAALLLFPAEPETDAAASSSVAEEVSQPAEDLTITNKVAADVKAVSVTNKEGSYRLVPLGSDGEFEPEGYGGYDVKIAQVTLDVDTVIYLTATKNLGAQENLEDFGLAGEEAVNVTVECSDGESISLILGNKSPETSGRYVWKDGSVYIVDGINDRLYQSVFTYFNTEIFTVADLTETVVDEDGNATDQTLDDRMDNITLSGTNFPETIRIEYQKTEVNEYVMTQPVMAESNTETFQNILSNVKSLASSGVVDVRLDAETLEKYGLDEPFARAEYELNGEKHTIAVSAVTEEGDRYMIADDTDTVYRIPRASVEEWAECSLMDLRQSYIWLPGIMQVESLSLRVEGDMTYRFDTTRTKNEEKTNDSRVYYDQTVKNADGDDIEFKYYQDFYQFLIATAVYSVEREEWSGSPVLEATYSYFDGGSDTVAFYAADEGHYVAVLNGSFNGLVRKSEVDKYVALLPDLNAGKEIIEWTV